MDMLRLSRREHSSFVASSESRILALAAPQQPVEAPGAPQAPTLTPRPFWHRGPRGWIAATLLALVAVVLLLRPW